MAEDDYDPLRKRTTVRSHQGDVLRSRRQRQIRQMLNEGSGEMDSVVSSASLRSMCGEWPASENFWRLLTFACCGLVVFFWQGKGVFFPHVAPYFRSQHLYSHSGPFSGLPLNRTSVHMPGESANANCAIHFEVWKRGCNHQLGRLGWQGAMVLHERSWASGAAFLAFFSFVLIRSTQANPHHKQHVMFFLTFLEKSQVKSWAWFQLHLTLDLAAVREQRA